MCLGLETMEEMRLSCFQECHGGLRLWDKWDYTERIVYPLPLWCCSSALPYPPQDTEDLDHYEMKEEEPAEGKKSEDDGIGKENLAILEKIKKNQRQDYLNVRAL